MTSCLTQIKKSYEELGMTPEEIAVDQDLELSAVKATLMQYSVKYRKECGKEGEDEEDPTLNFSDDELRQVNRGILELALGAEDEGIRFRALTYIRDDKKGRKDVVKAVARDGGLQVNILSFNQQLAKARELASGARQKLIELPSGT